MLKAENLSKSFGETVAVDGVSLEVEEGEIVGLIGPNGAGKSTTMEMCAGLLEPDSGEVEAERDLKDSVGIVFQNLELDSKITVREFLSIMRVLNGSDVEVEPVLESLGLDAAGSWVSELSGGQRKKLNIASALMKQPDYLLLDESAAGLDVQSRTALEKVIERLGEERGVLLSTHSMDTAEKLCDRARYRDDARVSDGYLEIFCEEPHEVLKHMVETGKIDEVEDIGIDRPGLEEVYLDATGERYAQDS
ncbi:MAG: ABC transporter ATP-binding protein [Candidatus Nanohaloarchaea archaeon]